MVVRGGEDAQVGQSLKSDGVEGSGVSDSERVSSDRSGRNRVGRFGSDQETISSDDLVRERQQMKFKTSEDETDGVGGEGGSLEDVEVSSSVEGRLLEDGGDEGGLGGGSGQKVSDEVELES